MPCQSWSCFFSYPSFSVLQFRHRGVPDTPLERENSTSTEIMLSSTQRPEFTWYPWKPPQKYNEKDSRNFKTSNQFSEHNNRNYLQDHGVYFGNVSLILLSSVTGLKSDI